MNFLTPWSALFAAALVIPLLLLLYFLRLRRQRLRVASTLLWEKSFEDLQANALFQRLRWSLLLLLQLLLLIALLLALAQPVMRGEAAVAPRTVLLIDRSASMNAAVTDQRTETRTRLDVAKDSARQMINALGRSGRAQQMMIIEFGATPRVVTTYESNRRTLLAAIESIQPSDETADLDAALQLAGAYAGGETAEEQPPEVVLISDGCMAGVGNEGGRGFTLRSGTFRFVQVPAEGESSHFAVNNLGITSFSVRRDEEDPARVLAFVRLLNAGPNALETIVTVRADQATVATIRRTVPGASAAVAGEDSFTHALEIPGGAVLSVQHNHRDDLPADDIAWLLLPEPSRPRLALVHSAGSTVDPFLHDLLNALEPQAIRVISDEFFASLDETQINAGALFDLIVFDRVRPARWPGVASLSFGAASDAPLPETAAAGQPILSWDRQHPLLRHVSLDTIIFTGADALPVPAGATALVYGPRGPVVVELRARGARHVVVAFELLRSNWPLHVSSAVFAQNALDYLTLARLGATGVAFRAGDAVKVRVLPEATNLAIRLIEGGRENRSVAASSGGWPALSAEPGGLVSLPSLPVAGLYEIAGAAPPHDQLAVNVMSESESDIRPPSALIVNAEQAAVWSGNVAGTRPLWPWLIAAAMALVVIEWLVYCRKAAG